MSTTHDLKVIEHLLTLYSNFSPHSVTKEEIEALYFAHDLADKTKPTFRDLFSQLSKVK